MLHAWSNGKRQRCMSPMLTSKARRGSGGETASCKLGSGGETATGYKCLWCKSKVHKTQTIEGVRVVKLMVKLLGETAR
eukprot:2757476-Amphidinium_carterae.1